MPPQNFLDNLRNKPYHHRKRISFFAAFGLTVVVFMFWAYQFGENLTGTGVPSTQTAAVTEQSPFDQIKNIFADTASHISTGWSRARVGLNPESRPDLNNRTTN